MTKTLRDQFIAALEARGESYVGKDSITRYNKFMMYTRKEGGYYFVGKSGSLRFGQTLTTSIPCSDRFKQELLG